jgi:hypothetical protein
MGCFLLVVVGYSHRKSPAPFVDRKIEAKYRTKGYREAILAYYILSG